MNKSLKFVKEITQKNNPDAFTVDAFWSTINFLDQLEEDAIKILDDNNEIKICFDYKETNTTIFSKIKYVPDYEFQTTHFEGRELNKLGSPELGKQKLSLEILKYLFKGEWIQEKTKRLGYPVTMDFYVGDFICVTDDTEKDGRKVPIMMMFLPIAIDFKLGFEEYGEEETDE